MKLQNRTNFTIVIFGLFSIGLSLIKFKYCFERDFAGLAAVSHGCYTDIPIFWNSHLFEVHIWPYKELKIPEINDLIKPVEYPFMTGLIMWLLSYITPLTGNSDGNFFIVNALFISLLFIASYFILNKIKTKSFTLLAASPALALSLFINWDMWVVFTLLLAVYFYDANKINRSSLFLAMSISFKFFPIAILPIVLILGLKTNQLKMALQYVTKVIMFFTLINLPAAIYNFDGWFYFYKFSSERSFGLGSIWEILDFGGSDFEPNNAIYMVCTFGLFVLISYYIFKFETRLKLSELGYFFIFAFVLFNKIYSPQYVIWLSFLAVLTIQTTRQKIFFVIWQVTELIYHFAIWRFLFWQGYGHQSEGLNLHGYLWSSIARYIGLLMFTGSLIYPRLKKNLSKRKR